MRGVVVLTPAVPGVGLPVGGQHEIARNTNFGTGAYPGNPSRSFNQVTAVGDPRSWQFALRLRF
jgi:hypothetical protein